MGRLRASALPRGRQAGSCQSAGLSWSLHACIHPILTPAGTAGALGRFREEKPRWGKPVAQWRPAQASGRVGTGARTRGKEARREQSRRNAGRGRACAHPAEAQACTAPSSFTPFPRSPSRHRPHLCRRLWVLLKNRNRLHSHCSSGPAYSVYELRQVTQPVWASTSSSVKWGKLPVSWRCRETLSCTSRDSLYLRPLLLLLLWWLFQDCLRGAESQVAGVPSPSPG